MSFCGWDFLLAGDLREEKRRKRKRKNENNFIKILTQNDNDICL
jgi:hypothetical protein